MILGHLHPGIFETHIYSFHMFLFFFLSGYLFSTKPLKSVIIRNIKTLLIPFFCAGVIAEIIDLLLSQTIEYNALASLFYLGGDLTWNRPIWFLIVLFEATVLTHLINRFTYIYYISIFCSFCVGYFFQNTNFSFGLSILPVAYCWIGIGYLSKKYLIKFFNNDSKANIYYLILFAIINFCFSYILNTRISMLGSYYGNYLFAYIAGFSGICMYWIISKLIQKNTIIESFGKHGVLLLSTQYILFKTFSIISIKFFQYDIWKESGFIKAILMSAFTLLLYLVIIVLYEAIKNKIILFKTHNFKSGETNEKNKKIIGYTTGVYDMFHIGHLNIIKKAKEQCDYLIVGVSTNELVQTEKGKTPIIPFEERKEIIASLKYVDKVVPQFDKNKFAAWEKYHFNKMFVGNDWKGTSAWNEFEKQFKPLGVEIVYLPHTDGISSTKLTEIVKNLFDE